MTAALLFLLLFSVNLCAKHGADSIIYITDLPDYDSETRIELPIAITGPRRLMKADQTEWTNRAFDESKSVIPIPISLIL